MDGFLAQWSGQCLAKWVLISYGVHVLSIHECCSQQGPAPSLHPWWSKPWKTLGSSTASTSRKSPPFHLRVKAQSRSGLKGVQALILKDGYCWYFNRLYSNLHANHQWMSDLHEADVIIIVTHSQGCVVSTHLLDRLIRDGHIITSNSQTVPLAVGIESFPSAIGSYRTIQKICCLGLCGIRLGPLRYLCSSTLVGPYLQVSQIAYEMWYIE